MSQENFLDSGHSFSSPNENPSIQIKVIGIGGAEVYFLVDGLAMFNRVEQLAVDVDSRPERFYFFG